MHAWSIATPPAVGVDSVDKFRSGFPDLHDALEEMPYDEFAAAVKRAADDLVTKGLYAHFTSAFKVRYRKNECWCDVIRSDGWVVATAPFPDVFAKIFAEMADVDFADEQQTVLEKIDHVCKSYPEPECRRVRHVVATLLNEKQCDTICDECSGRSFLRKVISLPAQHHISIIFEVNCPIRDNSATFATAFCKNEMWPTGHIF